MAVLNATEIPHLAHRVASELQRIGYSQAAAQSGTPPVADTAESMVQYSAGHRGEAEGVARTLSIGHVVPIESSVSSLSGAANVVVVVGADKSPSP